MKKAFSLVFAVIFSISTAYSVNTTSIESLRRRTVSAGTELSSSDIASIEAFWTTALDQMLLAETSLELVEIRRQLEEQKGEGYLSYYASAYISQAAKSIQTAFENAQRLDSARQRQIVERNLMILVGNLKGPKLAPIAIQRLKSEDGVIRYWAVKSITQPDIVQQLTDEVTGDEVLVETILTSLKDVVADGTESEIRKMVIRFCTSFNHPMAREILLTIATERIQAYQKWNVGDVQPDVQLLTALGGIAMLNQDVQVKNDFGRAFAELYALIMQRYLMGVDVLGGEQIEQMSAVIAAVDQNVLDKTMGIRTGILQALRTRNISVIKREYDAIFGDSMRQGKLAELLKFDYGKDSDGKPITTPPQLPPMPDAESE